MPNDLTAPPASPLDALLADPAKLKELPVETMERLFALQREARRDQAAEVFAEALLAVQRQIKPVAKTGHNTHTKSWYAKIEDVDKMLDPLLAEHGITASVSSRPSDKPEHTVFILTLRKGIHSEQHELESPLDYLGPGGKANKTKMHGLGSSYTYCGRYLKANVFNIQTFKDDDGNAGGGVSQHQPRTERRAGGAAARYRRRHKEIPGRLWRAGPRRAARQHVRRRAAGASAPEAGEWLDGNR